jgi:hypothetical protein
MFRRRSAFARATLAAMKLALPVATLLLTVPCFAQPTGRIGPAPGVPVRLVDAATGAPIAGHKVHVFSDNGVRCIRAPCDTEASSWDGTSDEHGLITPPVMRGTVSSDGYDSGRMLESDTDTGADGQLLLALDPDAKTNAQLRRYHLQDAATGAPLANSQVTLEYPDCAAGLLHVTTNALGNFYYSLRCLTSNGGTVTVPGYRPGKTPSAGWVNFRVPLNKEGAPVAAPATPLPAAGKGIDVVEGTLGSDCARSGTHTDALARACNGKQRCEFIPDLSKAAATCQKDFVAKWRCGVDERVSLRLATAASKAIMLSCEAPAPAPTPPATGAQIRSATYGGNCGAPAGNESAVVAAACNGKNSCSFVIDWKELGDPAHGCGKNFVVEWRCGGSSKPSTVTVPAEAGLRKTALISCP